MNILMMIQGHLYVIVKMEHYYFYIIILYILNIDNAQYNNSNLTTVYRQVLIQCKSEGLVLSEVIWSRPGQAAFVYIQTEGKLIYNSCTSWKCFFNRFEISWKFSTNLSLIISTFSTLIHYQHFGHFLLRYIGHYLKSKRSFTKVTSLRILDNWLLFPILILI